MNRFCQAPLPVTPEDRKDVDSIFRRLCPELSRVERNAIALEEFHALMYVRSWELRMEVNRAK